MIVVDQYTSLLLVIAYFCAQSWLELSVVCVCVSVCMSQAFLAFENKLNIILMHNSILHNTIPHHGAQTARRTRTMTTSTKTNDTELPCRYHYRIPIPPSVSPFLSLPVFCTLKIVYCSARLRWTTHTPYATCRRYCYYNLYLPLHDMRQCVDLWIRLRRVRTIIEWTNFSM